MDLILRNALIAGAEKEPSVDIGIEGGRIAAIEAGLAAEGEEIELGGRLVSPGFIETHIHLDKSCLLDRCKSVQGTLEEAISEVAKAKRSFQSEAPVETAAAVKRLLDAGADLAGKTHTDEMAYSLTGENVHYGTPVNARAPDRIPGGSSNGSAAAVAAGLVDFAIGTDCGGSVRLPASYCGIFGMRPTVDRVPLDGVIPFGPPFDVAGWFARDAAVLERVGRVLLADDSEPQPPRRLLRATDAFDMVDETVTGALDGAVETVAACVGAVEDVTVAPEGLESWFETFRVLQAASIWTNHGAWIREARPEFGPGVKERFEWAEALDDGVVEAAGKRYEAIQARICEVLGPGDILCLPTSPRTAPLKNTPVDDIEIRYRHQAMHLLCIAGLGGLPQLSLPMTGLRGLPLGLSLNGPRGADMRLLRLTRQLMPEGSV